MPHWRELSATKSPGRALAAATREMLPEVGTAEAGHPWVKQEQPAQLGSGLPALVEQLWARCAVEVCAEWSELHMDMPSSGFALQGQLRRGWKRPCCVSLQVRIRW